MRADADADGPGTWAPTAVYSPLDDRTHVFAVASDGLLRHWWRDGDGDWAEPLAIEGEVSSPPSAVVTETGRLEVYARTPDGSLQRWTQELGGGWFSQVLSGWIPPGTGPRAAVRPDGRVDVLAKTAVSGGQRWGFADDLLVASRVPVACRFEPVPVRRGRDQADAIAVDWNGQLSRAYLATAVDEWGTTFNIGLGTAMESAPAVVSWGSYRIDVFARRNDRTLQHWGWDGRIGLWFPDSLGGALASAPAAVSWAEDRLDVFALGEDTTLWHWWWDATLPAGSPWPSESFGSPRLRSAPVALSRGPGRLDVFIQEEGGRIEHHQFDGGWGVRFLPGSLTIVEPVPDQPPAQPQPVGPPADPDLLLIRPADHLVLGVRWSGLDAVTGPDGSPILQPNGEPARIVLVVPPQHIAEEVIFHLPAEAGELTRRRAWLSGVSRVAFEPPVGVPVPLNAEGILAALGAGRVIPANGDPAEAADRTGIELPWRLALSPESRSGTANVVAEHPDRPIESPAGSVGLWVSRLRAADADPLDAGLVVRPTDLALAKADDPDFFTPLRRAGRLEIVQAGQSSPAPARRLELSSLGGSLSAAAAWPGFRWEHDAVLGRDQRVRTVAQGVLYPFGHRAEYVELTERVLDPNAPEPVAVLHSRLILSVTEPVRRPADDVGLRRGFPFDEVEIMTTTFTDLSPANWVFHALPPTDHSGLPAVLAELHAQVDAKRQAALDSIFGPGTTTSDYAPASDDEVFGNWHSEAAAHEGHAIPAVEAYYAFLEKIAYLEAELHAATPEVPLFFQPQSSDGQPLRIPVRCAGRDGDLRFSLPMLFVRDHDLPPSTVDSEYGVGGFDFPGFKALTDPAVAARLADAYGSVEVALPGVPVDLVRAEARAAGDVQEVHVLTIGGADLDAAGLAGGYRAALRGFSVALPALRTLLPDVERPLVPLTFSAAYRTAGEAADVVFQLPGERPPKPWPADYGIPVDFTAAADRSGGLISPQLVADGLSRTVGPVDVEGMLNRAADGLDPNQIFGSGFTVLGFDIRQLVDRVPTPPAIVTDLLNGQQPAVIMRWEVTGLRSPSPFVAGPTATLDLRVESSPSRSLTTCTVTDFALHLPSVSEPLLKLSFGSITFTQEPGQPPRLELSGVNAEFAGLLNLLKKLADVVDLGNHAPRFEVSKAGIVADYVLPVPDVATGAFGLRNIVLHARVDVPFDGRPVSVGIAFASRDKPFSLNVLTFGGGGYVDVQLDHTGLRRLEVSLEFGAMVAVDFVVAAAEVHAVGGVTCVKHPDGRFSLTGFIRIGGSVEILGLVSVAVDLRVELTYVPEDNLLVGRATLVVEIDLTLFSESVELDSGRWVLMGDEDALRRAAVPPPPPEAPLLFAAPDDAGLAEWLAYRARFVTR